MCRTITATDHTLFPSSSILPIYSQKKLYIKLLIPVIRVLISPKFYGDMINHVTKVLGNVSTHITLKFSTVNSCGVMIRVIC